MRANLHREALEAARAAVTELDEGGAGADVAEARVLLASAELADGATADAIVTAQVARRALQRQRRPALAALADHVIVRARAAHGSHDRRTMERALRCADALAEAGLVAEELDARLTAGLVARDLGDGAWRRRPASTRCEPTATGGRWWSGPAPGRPRRSIASTGAIGAAPGGPSRPAWTRWPTSRR